MTAPRFSAPVYALFIVVAAIAAGPTCARANDFAMPFGGKAASQPAAAAFAANADESGSVHVSSGQLGVVFRAPRGLRSRRNDRMSTEPTRRRHG